MTNRSFPQTVRKYLAAADTYAITLPKALHAELTTTLANIDTADKIDLNGPTVAEAAYNAISKGDDPIDSPEVHRAIARRELTIVFAHSGVQNVAADKLEQTVRDHVEELAAAYQPTYNTAGARFTEAHTILAAHGIEGLNDPRVGSMGLDVAKANLEAREANKILHDLNEALTTLLLAVGRLEGSPVGAFLRNTDAGNATGTQILEAFRGKRSAEPWDIATAGYTISLATPSEAKARRDRAYSAQDASRREASRDTAQEARAAAMQHALR